MISQKSVEEVIERAHIEDVVQDFVSLKRRGANLLGLCPFHHEKTPSFNVSPSRNIFKCFGCGKAGNSVRFLMDLEGYDFVEAIRYLAAKYNIVLEETVPDAQALEAQKERETVYKVIEFANQVFKNNLHTSDEGQAAGLGYMHERGFRAKTIEDFGIGYAPQQSDSLVKAARKAGYSDEILRKAGLMTASGQDFFRHRVIFPIFNVSGKPIAFAGRQLIAQKNSPKYLNSPETDIYIKRKVLYGLFQARKAIKEQNNCFLVEGYTDVMSLYQAGIHNVVASSGTALTSEQIRLIKRYASQITVLYDSDPAGIKAALRGLDLILEENMDVRLALLPEGEDPDSFVQKSGLSGFQDFISRNSQDFILFKTQLLLKEAGQDPIRKAALVKDLIASLAHIPEAIKRSTFITEVSHLLKMDEPLLVRETNKAYDEFLRQKRVGVPRDIDDAERETQRRVFENETPIEVSLPTKTDNYQERDIVRILLNYGDKPMEAPDEGTLAGYVLAGIEDVMDMIQNPLYSKIIKEYQQAQISHRILNHDHFTNHPDKEIQQIAIELLTFPYEYASWAEHDLPFQIQRPPEENYYLDATHAILRLKLRIIMGKIEENGKSLEGFLEDGNEEEIRIHLQIHNTLLQMRDQITRQFKNVVLKA